MAQNAFNPFAINDTDESLKAKSGGVFGLNQGNVTEFEYKDKNKDGETSHSVIIGVQIGDRTYRRFFYFNADEKVYVKGELSDSSAEGYWEAYGAVLVQRIAVIKHALKAVGVTQQQIDQVVSQIDPSDIVGGVKMLLELLPGDYKTKPVDVFLEYQWSIKKDQKETFLEVPDSMKGGIFLIPAVQPTGKWTEVRNEDGLSYVDNAGSIHPISRSAGYLDSPRAEKQTLEGNAKTASNGFNSAASNPQSAAKSTWGK